MKYNAFPILLATTFLSTSAMAITLEPTLDDSVISYSESTSTDYNFTTQEAAADGNLTTKYYKINIDEDKLSTSSSISWSEVDEAKKDENNVIEVQLPNNQSKYFKYTYTAPSGYVTTSTRVNDTLVTSDVTDVVFENISSTSSGGAINNTKDNADINIKADFIGNYAASSSYSASILGGAVYNYAVSKKLKAEIGNISGDFIDNHVVSLGYVYGGAISNYASSGLTVIIGDIIGNFIGNYAESQRAYGGAIHNYAYDSSSTASIGNITGNFINNNAFKTASSSSYGGAIYNHQGIIGNIIGDFIDNSASGTTLASGDGGAIYNHAYYPNVVAIIGNITGNFIGNYVDGGGMGGAIHNTAYYDGAEAIIGNITGDFIKNYGSNGSGGAICNIAYYDGAEAIIGNITGDFIENHIFFVGGAIYNYGSIGDINGDFIGNYTGSNAGAIFNSGSIGNISGSFIDNYVKVTDERRYALGGAIYTSSDLTFKADGKTHLFSGNYTEDSRGKINNAIWVNNSSTSSHPTLTFNIINGGAIIFDDEIDGGYLDNNEIIKDGYGYNLNISGDVCESCYANSITFNDKVSNVHDLTLDTTQMALGKNAYIEVTNNYIAKNNPLLRVEVDLKDGKAGQLFVDGNIYGKTSVIVDTKNYRDVRGEEGIVFAQSNGDIYLNGENGTKAETEEEKAQAFSVLRVVGSPYMWNVEYEDGGVEKIWSLAMNDTENTYTEDCDETPEEPEPVIPDEPIQPLGPIQVAPEIIGFETLPNAGLSQTNGLVYNIMRKVGVNRLFCPGCGFYDYNWDGEAFHNVWVDTTYNGLTIEAPVEIDANVWGIEAGSDLQHDLNNKLGIFASYRQGNYEMDRKGEKYYSTIGSEIDIDSYLAGLYYRYDKNNWYAFATVYGGMQNAEIKTDDGVSADTDGIEFGGSIEAGYSYALTGTLSATPSLGVFYSQISYDDATDSVGKTVNYNDLKQVELEAGIKFSQAEYLEDGFYAVYVKPSVVQTLIDGDEIEVTKLGKVDTIEDKSLGRVEIGANYGFNNNWSIYSWANYTFGSDYEATSLGLGLNYAW